MHLAKSDLIMQLCRPAAAGKKQLLCGADASPLLLPPASVIQKRMEEAENWHLHHTAAAAKKSVAKERTGEAHWTTLKPSPKGT